MIHKTDDAEHSCTVTWCPYVLRPSFLGLLSASALTLSFVVALLCGISSSRNGLGSDHGSSILLFGWRFTPSLVAVLYVQLTSMLLDGIKISEPFARLARSGGAPAAYTLFQPPGAWWDALADGLSTKKNGGRRSWVLICSACLNIIGFLAISPLSSSLLLSEDVLITQNVEFSRVVLNQGFSPLRIRTGRDTYLRTMGHILQNVSTSAWLSDDYAILPFWPSRMENVPLSPFLSTSQETWESETLVLKSELECNPMALAATGFTNDTFRYSYDNNETEARTRSNDKASIMLAADDGCTYGLALATDMEMVMRGGTSWSDVSTFIDRDQGQLREDLASSLYARLNHSEECGQRELLFATTPWNSSAGNFSFAPNFKVSAKICETKYFMAEMTVKGTLSEDISKISFDEDKFRQMRVPISDSLLDINGLQGLTLSPDWTNYTALPDGQTRSPAGGLSVLLAALFDFEMPALVAADSDLQRLGSNIKQRFFGEALQFSLVQDEFPRESLQGRITLVQKRVVVTTGTSIALAVSLFISFGLSLLVWWLSRPQRRPLHLRANPATTLGAASLITSDTQTRFGLRRYSKSGRFYTTRSQDGELYSVADNALHELDGSIGDNPGKYPRLHVHTLVKWLINPLIRERRPRTAHKKQGLGANSSSLTHASSLDSTTDRHYNGGPDPVQLGAALPSISHSVCLPE